MQLHSNVNRRDELDLHLSSMWVGLRVRLLVWVSMLADIRQDRDSRATAWTGRTMARLSCMPRVTSMRLRALARASSRRTRAIYSLDATGECCALPKVHAIIIRTSKHWARQTVKEGKHQATDTEGRRRKETRNKETRKGQHGAVAARVHASVQSPWLGL